jgi:hypothetical protein
MTVCVNQSAKCRSEATVGREGEDNRQQLSNSCRVGVGDERVFEPEVLLQALLIGI